MELIRISNDKIKISLSKAELEAYELSVDSMDYGRPEAKEAFRELFVEAREQTGFEADGEKVFVQIFRAKNGGCEIFVSKISKPKKQADSSTESTKELFVYKSLDDLISACRSLSMCGIHSASDAYRENEEYYLILSSPNELEIACATEYGTRGLIAPSEYIAEHFRPIRLSDAVYTLSLY